ncbi:MAG: selenium metabolism-associated LysR family transcriptional regulator [Pyrinomonadaceae bacterium]
MDVRDLQVFLSVAKHLNFTRAGEEVHLSQPSVSVRMRQLERNVGSKLFEQLGKRIALTEAGQLLLPHAIRVIAAMDDARHAIDELQGLERGSLRIGASTTPGMYLIPRTIAQFKQSYPKIAVMLAVRDTRQIEEGVIRNEFDFGFVGGHLAGDEVEVVPWITDELKLIVPPGHRLARKKTVKPQDLSSEKFIFREQGSATRAVVAAHLRKSRVETSSVMEIENPESVKKAVQHGLGVAFISAFAAETELKAKTLVAVKIQKLEVLRELKIVYRKDKHLSRAAHAFIEMARQRLPAISVID